MSCNGCRVLRKGCSDACVLRPCLQWIDAADAQAHATLFLAKFFGRAGLLSFISAVPDAHRPALFRSLLYEAAGRTINPVGGAVGLLATGSWHLCLAAVDTVLRGGTIGPLPGLLGGAVGTGAGTGTGGSTFSAAKRARKDDAVVWPPPPPVDVETSCGLGLCLSPGSPPPAAAGLGERRALLLLRPETPSMSSDGSVTTTTTSRGDGRSRAPVLLNLFA